MEPPDGLLQEGGFFVINKLLDTRTSLYPSEKTNAILPAQNPFLFSAENSWSTKKPSFSALRNIFQIGLQQQFSF